MLISGGRYEDVYILISTFLIFFKRKKKRGRKREERKEAKKQMKAWTLNNALKNYFYFLLKYG